MANPEKNSFIGLWGPTSNPPNPDDSQTYTSPFPEHNPEPLTNNTFSNPSYQAPPHPDSPDTDEDDIGLLEDLDIDLEGIKGKFISI